MSGTNWYTLKPNTLADASQVNSNFDWLEGHVVPMVGGSLTTAVYDIGSALVQWRTGYFKTSVIINSTTISGPCDNSTTEISSNNIRLKAQGIRGSTANSGGTAQEISQGTISTPDIRSNAVTLFSSGAQTGNSAFGTTISSLSITTTGGKVLILANVDLSLSHPASGELIANVSVSKSGSGILGGDATKHYFGYDGAGGLAATTTGQSILPFAISCVDSPAAGTYSYDFTRNVSSGTFNEYFNFSFILIEFRA